MFSMLKAALKSMSLQQKLSVLLQILASKKFRTFCKAAFVFFSYGGEGDRGR